MIFDPDMNKWQASVEERLKKLEAKETVKVPAHVHSLACWLAPCGLMPATTPSHTHCWHDFTGSLAMYLEPGHKVQECCDCKTTRTVHHGHV